MVLDHYAVAIYLPSASARLSVYEAMRAVGRLAFPIYCFLLVEGFYHTHNVKQYILRCFAFAVISELPFDLALHGTWFYPKGQNVFFTLAIGLCTLYAISYYERKQRSYITSALCTFIGAAAAQLFETDYHFMGVLCIVMFCYLRRLDNGAKDVIGAIIVGIVKPAAALAFIPIHFYNGQRGMRLKYFFYWVYPVHLLVLGLIRLL